jgi:hypothetical protein
MTARVLRGLGILVLLLLVPACGNTPTAPTPTPITWQAQLAAQLDGTLWPGIQPGPTNGVPPTNANQPPGSGWVTPTLEELQIFDLLDRTVDPIPLIVWMNTHGYPTQAVYSLAGRFPAIQLPISDIVLAGGGWNLVPHSSAPDYASLIPLK